MTYPMVSLASQISVAEDDIADAQGVNHGRSWTISMRKKFSGTNFQDYTDAFLTRQ
jgi:hypothetical protein